MGKMAVRTIIVLCFLVCLLTAYYYRTWTPAMIAVMLGIYYEIMSLRDITDRRINYKQQSLSRLNIFENEGK